MFGFDADLTPRKIRQAATRYGGAYLPELDIDVFAALRVVDYGDAAIIPGDLAASIASVQARVADVLAAGAIPITLGGSAPCSGYACAAALSAHYSGGSGEGGQQIGTINLDAHGDNRESWQGSSALQAGTWVRHQLQLPGFRPQDHMQIGMRGPGNPKSNADWFKEQGCGFYTSRHLQRMGIAALTDDAIRRASAETVGLWYGVDLDVLDISVSPDWTYPNPLGLSANDLLHVSFAVGKRGCLGASTMSSPAHATSMHWIVIWTLLYLMAGVAVGKGRAEVSDD